MIGVMHDNQGFDVLHHGVWRSFRDTKEAAYAAARFMLQDGRTG